MEVAAFPFPHKRETIMKYFTIGELCHSATADKRGIKNTCTKEEAENLKELVNKVLDPLREMYGKPITVNSGYRCVKLNRAVGGVPTSQHVRGEAADITAGSPDENRKLMELIRKNLTFDQCIDEKNGAWVHVSYKRIGLNRNQFLKL